MFIPDYPVNREIPLPATGTWPESIHRFEADTVAALRAAVGRLFLSVVIDGRTEAQDLLWRYDAVARLSDAQVDGKGARDAAHYLSPGPLWWAYDWQSAEDQWNPRKQGEVPEKPEGWTSAAGTVLLIDEIDKADPDLPNAFLELLGNRGFTVPYLGQKVVRGDIAPLVVITTNEERELPQAFLRRCLVLTLRLPEALKPWLVEMGVMHLKQLGLAARLFPEILEQAADQLIADRQDAQREQNYAPGLAEYLDLVIALARLGETAEKQEKLLKTLACFALRKSSPETA